jgi:UDPglucose 6-dehydrogenase
MKIVVVGLGYVGLANAMLLAKDHEVIAVDIDAEKVSLLNQGISPIDDIDIQERLKTPLHFQATRDLEKALVNADYVLIATPTNYDPKTRFFDTQSIHKVVDALVQYGYRGSIVIKSTVGIGFTEMLKRTFPTVDIFFSPEFLREGKALHDNLYPSRIVIGDNSESAHRFGKMVLDCVLRKDVPILHTNNTEAEAIKLFANTHLAMRVAFFNELDMYCEIHGLDSRHVIEGVCLDPRIGMHYNNPSFGYGGYCLPKDTKQMCANFEGIDQSLMTAIVESNKKRKRFVVDRILEKHPKKIGMYRLVMKEGSDNFRSAAIHGIIRRLQDEGVLLSVYEPEWKEETFMGIPVEKDFAKFKIESDVVLANRWSKDLLDIHNKVYTRDVFGGDF